MRQEKKIMHDLASVREKFHTEFLIRRKLHYYTFTKAESKV